MKKKRFLSFLSQLIGILQGAIFGLAMVWFAYDLLDRYDPSGGKAIGFFMMLMGICMFVLLLMMLVQIIIHEAGHLVFGLASGYGFVSFRILNIMFMRENGKIVRKKFGLAGTGGQCLLSPPAKKDGAYPYKLYNLGGGLMNIAVSIPAAVLYLLLRDSATIFAVICGSFAVMGLVTAVMNLLPMRISGIANDGYNLLMISKNESARADFYLQLQINAEQFGGKRVKDLPPEWFAQEMNLSNPISAAISVFRYNYLLDKHELEAAEELAETILDNPGETLELYQNELRCELIYLRELRGAPAEKIEELRTKKLKKYILQTSESISRQRMLYAYAKLVSHDEPAAEKALAAFEKAAKTHPLATEVELERELVAFVDAAENER